MYLGEFICKIDKKNRIFIPAPFRENLKEIILTYIDEDTLIIKSSENWTPDSILNNVTLHVVSTFLLKRMEEERHTKHT